MDVTRVFYMRPYRETGHAVYSFTATVESPIERNDGATGVAMATRIRFGILTLVGLVDDRVSLSMKKGREKKTSRSTKNGH